MRYATLAFLYKTKKVNFKKYFGVKSKRYNSDKKLLARCHTQEKYLRFDGKSIFLIRKISFLSFPFLSFPFISFHFLSFPFPLTQLLIFPKRTPTYNNLMVIIIVFYLPYIQYKIFNITPQGWVGGRQRAIRYVV